MESMGGDGQIFYKKKNLVRGTKYMHGFGGTIFLFLSSIPFSGVPLCVYTILFFFPAPLLLVICFIRLVLHGLHDTRFDSKGVVTKNTKLPSCLA